MKDSLRLTALLLGVALLGACATNAGLRESNNLALYQAHAGEPVDSFSYYGSISGWTLLGDTTLAVWPRPSRAYLLELHGPCSDLAFAHAIALSSRMGQVHARFDDVTPLSRGSTPFPCRIREIRPLDVKALKRAGKLAQDQSAPSGT
ncbi:DUF6491 family protein [Luteimonas vadosa]|uniref:DUF6491 family protein n=1 Tax=Luteimonas vadosa TaxID=1165507 RepID=A0ABP9E243_9GAMM